MTARIEQVIVRPWGPEDAPAVLEAVRESLAELVPWMAWCHPGYGAVDAQSYSSGRPDAWSRGEEYALAIVAPDGQFLGGTGLNFLDLFNRRANLGYWVRTSATGQGVATAVAARVARWALEEMAWERVEIVAAAANRASHRVAERLGARFEGLARARIRVGSDLQAARAYALTRDDLPAISTPEAPRIDWQVPSVVLWNV